MPKIYCNLIYQSYSDGTSVCADFKHDLKFTFLSLSCSFIRSRLGVLIGKNISDLEWPDGKVFKVVQWSFLRVFSHFFSRSSLVLERAISQKGNGPYTNVVPAHLIFHFLQSSGDPDCVLWCNVNKFLRAFLDNFKSVNCSVCCLTVWHDWNRFRARFLFFISTAHWSITLLVSLPGSPWAICPGPHICWFWAQKRRTIRLLMCFTHLCTRQ